MTIIKSVDGGSPGQYLNIYSDQVNFNLYLFCSFKFKMVAQITSVSDAQTIFNIHILQDSMSENELELDNLAQSCNENLKTSTFP